MHAHSQEKKKYSLNHNILELSLSSSSSSLSYRNLRNDCEQWNCITKCTHKNDEKWKRERKRERQKWGDEEDTLAWVAKIYCYKMLQHSLSVLCVHDCSVFVYHSFIHLVIHCFTFILLFFILSLLLFFFFFWNSEMNEWTYKSSENIVQNHI